MFRLLVGWLVFEAADAYFMFLLFCSALQSKLRRALVGDRFYALHGGHLVLSLPNYLLLKTFFAGLQLAQAETQIEVENFSEKELVGRRRLSSLKKSF